VFVDPRDWTRYYVDLEFVGSIAVRGSKRASVASSARRSVAQRVS
jgi:hypothetical protein